MPHSPSSSRQSSSSSSAMPSSSSTSYSASAPPATNSKFAKLLTKSARDRSKSLAEATSPSTPSSSSSSPLPAPAPPSSSLSTGALDFPSPSPRRGLLGRTANASFRRAPTQQQRLLPAAHADGSMTDAGETFAAPPRSRTRSERPLLAPPPAAQQAMAAGQPRIADRLSGWFSTAFNASANDLSLPHILQRGTSPPPLPERTSTSSASQSTGHSSAQGNGRVNGLLTAARTGKGHLDRAVRYILDADAAPDRCTAPIWLLGVEHPGHAPAPPPAASPSPARRRSSNAGLPPSAEDEEHASLSRSTPAGGRRARDRESREMDAREADGEGWPAEFFRDFESRVWLTYRSQFPPIRDTTLRALDLPSDQASIVSASPGKSRWAWAGFGERGWTSDSGWGCMLRTGQSLLANALVHLHLGRDWRRPPGPQATAAYARYVEILTWFLDAPSPLCPFSVHRMALAGKELGKDVGQWFGPSTAAGALRTLTDAFPEAGLGVAVAVDSQVFQTDVFAASWDPRAAVGAHRKRTRWGGRAVLVLVGLRLGLDGVNPIYYESVKTLFTWPQSMGIAGGRPSSSYYFVGTQADSLFYLDPHHARPAVPLRPPPPPPAFPSMSGRGTTTPPRSGTPSSSSSPIPIHGRSATRDDDESERSDRRGHARSPTSPVLGARMPGQPGSPGAASMRPQAPSPLAKELSNSSESSGHSGHARWRTSAGQSSSASSPAGAPPSLIGSSASLLALEPAQQHYVSAYGAADVRSFSCARVRKLPLGGLDPSMLLGFLVRDEREWADLRARVAALGKTHRAIFSVGDEPPSWERDMDSDMGLESLSEPDVEEDEEALGVGKRGVLVEDEEDEEADFFDASEGRPSFVEMPARTDSAGSSAATDDDPAAPLTPGAGSFSLRAPALKAAPSNMSGASDGTFASASAGPLDDDEGELIGARDWADEDEEDADEVVMPRAPGAPVRREPRERVETVRPERVGAAQAKKAAAAVVAARSTPSPSAPVSPPMSRTASASSASSASLADSRASAQPQPQRSAGDKKERTVKGKKRRGGVPVPFPSADMDREREEEAEGRRVPQMSERKGRDGGRTQSGGVRGVLSDEV